MSACRARVSMIIFHSFLVATMFVMAASLVLADDCRRVKDIIILFDGSGFVKEQDRYKGILEHMEFFRKAVPVMADGFFNVGIRHYGWRVGMRCKSTESILGLQPWDPERFINSFPKTVSYGTSALSAGLRAASEDLAASEGPAVIVVIGGGLDSCDSDPVRVAEQIAFNNPNVEIHTFQLGGEQEGRVNLREIARKGRGTSQHLREVGGEAGWHMWMRRHLVVPCAGPASPGGSAQPIQPLPAVGTVTFDSNSFLVRSKDSNSDAANLASLQAVTTWLQANPNGKVILHGFCDSKGSPQQNLKNSTRLAEAVSEFLTATFRVDPGKITFLGHGMTKAFSQGAAPTNQRMLRRVEFELIQ
jgi:outer membrane protein OmpA-like peptidoglycan-associated protein